MEFFEIAINLFQGWMFTYVPEKKLTRRAGLSEKKALIARIATILAVGAFFSLYLWVDVSISDTAVWGLVLAYTLYAFRDRWYMKVCWTAVVAIVTSCITSAGSMLLMHMTGDSWEKILEPSLLRTAFVIFTNVILFASFFIITRAKPRQTKLSWLILAAFIAVIAALFTAVELLFSMNLKGGTPGTLTALFCIMAAIPGVIALFEMLSHQAEKQTALETQLEIHRMTDAHIAEVQSMYAGLMEYRHDMKHQMEAIEQLIAGGNADEGRAHLAGLQEKALPVKYATGCVAVDAILTAKTLRMENAGIEFRFDAYPLHELPVSTADFCSILGNILDNAMEGALQAGDIVSDRKIELRFSRTRDMLYINCRNFADTSKLIWKNGALMSTKRNGRPGMGIASMQRIIDAAEGMFSLEAEENSVHVMVALPYKRK